MNTYKSIYTFLHIRFGAVNSKLIRKLIRCSPIGTLLILFVCALPMKALAQKNGEKGMLMYQIDGNHYEKTSYDKQGNIKSIHLINVSNLISDSGEYKLKISFFALDENGATEDSSFTTLVCNPRDIQMLINIIPLATDNPGKTIRVSPLSSSESLYPAFGDDDKTLKDISFKVEIEGGVLGFLGTRSNVLIYNRQMVYDENDSSQAILTSQVEMKAYLLGIRVKKLDYFVTERLQAREGIVKQSYKSSSGEYFLIKLIH